MSNVNRASITVHNATPGEPTLLRPDSADRFVSIPLEGPGIAISLFVQTPEQARALIDSATSAYLLLAK